MTSSNADKKYLRQLGHNLKPVVTIASKGLTESVQLEIERALNDHELIKLKKPNPIFEELEIFIDLFLKPKWSNPIPVA